MSDDHKIPECDDCDDDSGRCDNPQLDEERYFSLTLKENFENYTVCNFNETYFFLYKHDLSFCFDAYFFIIN